MLSWMCWALEVPIPSSAVSVPCCQPYPDLCVSPGVGGTDYTAIAAQEHIALWQQDP